MRSRYAMPMYLLGGLLLLGLGCTTSDPRPRFPAITYPQARVEDQVDVYHGTPVPDPYRWLEDPDSPETREWIAAQNRITEEFLSSIPARQEIRDRLTELWNYERYGRPRQEGGRYFFTKNDGLQNQRVLYVSESLDGEPRVLLDPNGLSADGTISLAGQSPSPDGKLLAYGLSSSGSDWREWKVRNVDTGEDLADHLKWIKFSGASWSRDSRGFYYGRYDAPPEGEKLRAQNFFHKLYYHRVGTPQSEDTLVYERPDQKKWSFRGQVTEDGNWLVIYVSRGTSQENGIYYRDLRRPDAPVVELLNDFDARYGYLGNVGETFYFQTNLEAPRNRVIAIDVASPSREAWSEVVPQAADVLRSTSLLGGHLVLSYLKDAHSQAKVYDLEGALVRSVDLPGTGSLWGFSGHEDDPETFYSYSSFTSPPAIYRYDVRSGESRLWRRPEVDLRPEDYTTEQVFFESRDGTPVPMFLVYRNGLRRDGRNPTYLYGYGGFNVSLTPSFNIKNLVWLERGGIVAVANLRGGGEYGKEWHDAGRRHNKQNVFDDFIAAAEYLIENGYTSTSKLAIAGGSNGGLLVGACMTQRPDLFGACLPAVGVMDMLRFHKFTIGWAWVSDYGSPDDPQDFETLHAYSPLHNLEPGTAYPPTLITTADHDDRVVPAHSFKFAAALQAAHTGNNPVLIRIETRAGHGGGKPTEKRIEEATDQWAFLVRALGLEAEN